MVNKGVKILMAARGKKQKLRRLNILTGSAKPLAASNLEGKSDG